MNRTLPLTLVAAAALAAPFLPGTRAQDGATFDVAVVRLQLGDEIRSVVFRFHEEAAPKTVANFKKLVGENFYDGQAIHRAIPGYIVQTGDPLSKDPSKRAEWGTGDPGYTVPGEFGMRHSPGAVAMARLGDDINPGRASNGSQFYFALDSLPHLDNTYTVFGQVLTGFDVLKAIAAVERDINDNPAQRVSVLSIRLATNETVTATEDDAKPIRKAAAKAEAEDGKKSGETLGRFIKRFW